MKRCMIFLLTVCLVLSGCTLQQSAGIDDSPAPEKYLTICTPLEEKIWSPFVREFQERTGIWVQVEQGSAAQLLETFQKEPEQWDLLFGFDLKSLQEHENLLHDLSSPESSGTSEKEICVFWELPVIVYNPRLMQKNLPTAFRDLLDARWQGSISMEDPADSPLGKTILSALTRLDTEQTLENTLRQLGNNLPSFASGTQEVLGDVNDGTYLLGVVPESGALEAISRGSSIAIVYPEEETCLFAVGAGISAKSERPDAAKAFVDFIMEENTQRHMWEFLNLRPALDPEANLREKTCIPQQKDDANQHHLMELWNQLREERP